MPAALARVHPLSPRQYCPPDAQDVGVASRSKVFQLLWIGFQVLTWWNAFMDACTVRSGMVAEDARHWILNYHLDDHCNWRAWWWDHHPDPQSGHIVCISWRCNNNEEEKCSAFRSWFKKAASNKYENIKAVTNGNGNECSVNELNRCVREQKR